MDYVDSETLCFLTDLSLAGALCTVGYKLQGVDKTSPKKVVFLVEREKGIEKAVKDYFNGDLRVDPLSFANKSKELKRMIFNDIEY
jgi:hypothetical protein